jgi:hypothetical protein
MTHQEILKGFNSSIYSESTLRYLEANYSENIPKISEGIMAIAWGHYNKETAKSAQSLIKEKGNDIAKKALKIKSKMVYSKNIEQLLEDLEKLKTIERFDYICFVKYLYKLDSNFYPAMLFFYNHATDEEIIDYFKNDDTFRKFENGEPIDRYKFDFKNDIPERTAQLLWDFLPEIANKIDSFSCDTKGKIKFNFQELHLPILTKLSITGQFETFPTFIYQNTHIVHLAILSSTLTEVPEGIGNFQNLQSLQLGMPIDKLPSDFEKLKKLQELTLDDTLLTTLPDCIGTFKELTSLRARDNIKLTYIPPTIFELPNLSEFWKKNLKEKYMPKGGYEVLFNEFEWVIERNFLGIETVKEIYENYKQNINEKHIPELVLAAVRCYYDFEHGFQTNDFLFSTLEKKAPDNVKRINEHLKLIKFIDAFWNLDEQLNQIKTLLEPVKNEFDIELFVKLIKEMANCTYQEYPFKKLKI